MPENLINRTYLTALLDVLNQDTLEMPRKFEECVIAETQLLNASLGLFFGWFESENYRGWNKK